MKTQILLSLLIMLSACETSTNTEGSGPTEPNIVNVTTTTQNPTPIPTSVDTVTEFKLSCEEARFVSLLNIYRTNNNLSRIAVSKSAVESTRWHAPKISQQETPALRPHFVSGKILLVTILIC